jgi:hypothetical protein
VVVVVGLLLLALMRQQGVLHLSVKVALVALARLHLSAETV